MPLIDSLSYSPALSKQPFRKVGVGKGDRPHIVSNLWIFRVFNAASERSERRDHYSAFVSRNGLILAAVKGPNRQIAYDGGASRIAPSAQRHRGSEQRGTLDDQIPCSKATKGLAN
jgi:hypothetical protein